MNNPYPKVKARNEELRQRLDKLHACLTDCLFALQQEGSFYDMCSALIKESETMISYLNELEEQYQEELPLEIDEPKDVDWEQESERLAEFIEEMQASPYYVGTELPKCLCNKLTEIRDSMRRIDNGLYPEDDSDIYSSYSKRELEAYTMAGWNHDWREIRNQIAKPTNAHRPEYCKEQLDGLMGQLREISPYLINEDRNIIYHEGLGRELWQIRHDPGADCKIRDILFLIKGIEYFSTRVGCKLTFLDLESSPSEETDERVRLENLRQETLQNQLEKMAYRLSCCKDYLNTGFSSQWLKEMLRDLIHSEHSAQVCEKMKDRKLIKFVHQVAGVLKKCDAFVGCTHGEIVSAIGFNRPSMASRIDYIRKGVEDVPEIQRWLESYIANYRAELKTQAELSAKESVNVNC